MERRTPSRFRWFLFGVVSALAGLAGGAYVFVVSGGVRMDTGAALLPLEKAVARLALYASIGDAARAVDPLPLGDSNMLAGADQYGEHCAVCHGLPGWARHGARRSDVPHPPQLFESRGMVTNDPPGVTYWKVTHGIQLSGMPGFRDVLSSTQRWQVTMLLSHADTLSPAVRAALVPTAR